jgi:hypothetical protein
MAGIPSSDVPTRCRRPQRLTRTLGPFLWGPEKIHRLAIVS